MKLSFVKPLLFLLVLIFASCNTSEEVFDEVSNGIEMVTFKLDGTSNGGDTSTRILSFPSLEVYENSIATIERATMPWRQLG